MLVLNWLVDPIGLNGIKFITCFLRKRHRDSPQIIAESFKSIKKQKIFTTWNVFSNSPSWWAFSSWSFTPSSMMYSMKIFCWLFKIQGRYYTLCYDLYQLLRLWFEHAVTNNLFFWKAWSASMSFWRGKALAAGIIWQRISWTGAWRDTAKLIPGRSLWSLFIAWTTPTYMQTKLEYGLVEKKKITKRILLVPKK